MTSPICAYAATPTAGDVIFGKHDVQHQFLDVLTQLCGQAEGTAVSANGGLKGGAYPQVQEATRTGFAADYAANSDMTSRRSSLLRGDRGGTTNQDQGLPGESSALRDTSSDMQSSRSKINCAFANALRTNMGSRSSRGAL